MSIKNTYWASFDWVWTKMKVRKEKKKLNDPNFLKIAQSYSLSKENKEAIDDFYLSNLGEKIPYKWHQFFTAHSGVFDPRYFPNILLGPYFEHYMNYKRHYGFVFEDKNVIPYIAYCAGVKMPRTILSKTSGIIRDGTGAIVNETQAKEILFTSGIVFCKPSTVACGGRGCFVADFKSLGESFDNTIRSLGSEFIIQDIVECHESIKCIYPQSVNTFRVITYRWRDSFKLLPVFMRVGQGGAVVDNGAAGGMFIGVRTDGSLTEKAVMPYNTCILSHPDTEFKFKGHVIPGIQNVCDAAIRMHQMIPQLGLIYWDFTINTDGEPVLIECNVFNGTIYAIQMTHGVPAFGDNTAEVLQWIRKMKHTSYNKRYNFAFGN